jgi:hypothetical protein
VLAEAKKPDEDRDQNDSAADTEKAGENPPDQTDEEKLAYGGHRKKDCTKAR